MKPVPQEQPAGVIVLDDPDHGVKFTKEKNLREKMRIVLESRKWQWFIIVLILIDALLVRPCPNHNRLANQFSILKVT